ncbi:phage terminase small subunit P27 family [Peptostreptococcus equinus]|uniref:Phage terminase small subunit P27 family n=1 Tax=Peptostreptococcus equinus TaxID=3003601 RepID=A0ABY7JN10_9FIRM|nr:phage terminase small subunit P27 family [Peptostreptococcus sp. CBA3647]WAW14754.1 phage terminase small subunit P27 family [Peptostreptococcus sp. CBA3647]
MTRTGRPPKLSVVSTGKVGKEQKLKREIAESKLKVKRSLKAPTWLAKEAKKEFNRVIKESEPLEIIDNLDLSILAIYCNAYASYVDISTQINNIGLTYKDEKYENQLFVSNSMNRMVRMQKGFIETIMACSSKLGLATSDRLRLVVPKAEEKKENPFIKYL